MARTYRSRFPRPVLAALLVFVPLGLIGGLDDLIQRPLEDADWDDIGALQVVAITGAAGVDAAAATLGNIFFGGVIAAGVLATREGRNPSLVQVARTLPYWRLIVIDVAITLAVAIGLVLLIVPGLFLLARLVLAPAAEVEGRTVRGALAGSWRLVRGSSVRVLAVVLPILVAQAVISGAIESGATSSIGDTLLGDWLASTAGNVITAPFFALAVVVCYHELRDLRGLPPVGEPEGGGRATAAPRG